MNRASMLVARNVREDIGTGFVAVLFLASAVLVAYLVVAGLPNDASDGALSASRPAQRSDLAVADPAFAGAPVYRLPPVVVIGHRDAAAIAGERAAQRSQEAQAKPAQPPHA